MFKNLKTSSGHLILEHLSSKRNVCFNRTSFILTLVNLHFITFCGLSQDHNHNLFLEQTTHKKKINRPNEKQNIDIQSYYNKQYFH